MIPTKKISLTLIAFADPLIEELPAEYSRSNLEQVLKLSAGIWNACVLDQWHTTTDNVSAVRRQIAQTDPMTIAIIEALIARKKNLFGLDHRAITNECVVIKNGEFVVCAEARFDVENMNIVSRVH